MKIRRAKNPLAGLFRPEPKQSLEEFLAGLPKCGACGSNIGATLWERGPLKGLRRCWKCAKPVLARHKMLPGIEQRKRLVIKRSKR